LEAQLIAEQHRDECGFSEYCQVKEDRTTKEPADALGVAVGDECLQRGLSMKIVRSTGGMLNCFRMAPPLSITESEIAITIIDESLIAVLASRPH
jgi:2,2-dialkylglycine decarboxylase (pyruvate)